MPLTELNHHFVPARSLASGHRTRPGCRSRGGYHAANLWPAPHPVRANAVWLFYTPNAHLGIALSLLLVPRIGYYAAQLYVAETLQEPATALVRSPLTLLIFGSLAGYCVAYAVGSIRWQRRTRLADRS